MMAGAQYELRLSVPPEQVELPLVAIESAVELALVPVLPKNTCRCDRPGWPGYTIGSLKLMCEYVQPRRNAPTSAASIDIDAASNRGALQPPTEVGIFKASTAG